MTLVLTITNVERLDNGVPTRLRLDRHGAVIGRSPHADWCLPDPRHYISSTHCEIDYRDGAYLLVDKSTNGTFINGGGERLSAPRALKSGDMVAIGHYEIAIQVEGEGQAGAAAPAKGAGADWGGWDAHAGPTPRNVDLDAWDRAPAQAAISGAGPMSQNWTPPGVARTAAPEAASVWSSPPPPPTPASAWSSPSSETSANPAAVDIWGVLAAGNAVDWSRGGFGAPAATAPAADPFGLASAAPAAASDPFGLAPASALPASVAPATGPLASPASAPLDDWGPSSPSPASAAPAAAPAPPRPAGPWASFLAGAGLDPELVRTSPDEALSAAGHAILRMTAGLVVMLEARARAKAQLGAQGTALELQGNNPLKFARTPERALAQLLNPPERGFMPTGAAIEDAFKDLQAHQMATLTAMQGALAATLARFAPAAIRQRAESRGVLAKIIPAAREAELWKAYEREFEGVAKGSDEAFMDVFAKEFRTAYEQAAAELKR